MKRSVAANKKQDPRYKLLLFTYKYLTKNGKIGIKSKSYLEWHKRIPNIEKRHNYINTILKTLNLREYNYNTYNIIYDEMVLVGYTGERPSFTPKPYVIPLVPLYMKNDFLEFNEEVLKRI